MGMQLIRNRFHELSFQQMLFCPPFRWATYFVKLEGLKWTGLKSERPRIRKQISVASQIFPIPRHMFWSGSGYATSSKNCHISHLNTFNFQTICATASVKLLGQYNEHLVLRPKIQLTTRSTKTRSTDSTRSTDKRPTTTIYMQ